MSGLRTPLPATTDALGAAGLLSPLDLHFARCLGDIGAEERPAVLLAAALASRQVGQGHVCLDLRRRVQEPLVGDDGDPVDLAWPEIGAWLSELRASELVWVAGEGVAGAAAEAPPRPLVLDAAGRLYLQRYWIHQRRLAQSIQARVSRAPEAGAEPGAATASLLRRLFPAAAGSTSQAQLLTAPDWQRIAALAALEGRFCVISGGPGTGKTYAVVKILALLIEDAFARRRRPPRIQLVAPTGKAAARLKESIRAGKAALAAAEAVLAAIPEDAATIHRCLGSRPGSSTRFRHDRDNPLPADVVLVDEASMVDLALMARLAAALPADARLILLGDQNQLASVEAGAVLGDICNTGGVRLHSRAFCERVRRTTGDVIPLAAGAPAETGIWDCVIHLTHSYRYRADSGIGALASAINAGDAERALEVLAAAGGELSLVEDAGAAGREKLLATAVAGFSRYLAEETPAAQLRRLEGFRVLCAHRRGAHGVETINREIEAELGRRRLIATGDGESYVKRPLLITRNDYQLELFNGDVGVVGAPEEGQRAAYFVSPAGEMRALPLSRLPPHETVFAMTVHKSQGSELDDVAVVLPPEMSPVLSRELLYTAVSRARRRVTLFAGRDVLRAAIERRIERASGLRDLLWGGEARGR